MDFKGHSDGKGKNLEKSGFPQFEKLISSALENLLIYISQKMTLEKYVWRSEIRGQKTFLMVFSLCLRKRIIFLREEIGLGERKTPKRLLASGGHGLAETHFIGWQSYQKSDHSNRVWQELRQWWHHLWEKLNFARVFYFNSVAQKCQFVSVIWARFTYAATAGLIHKDHKSVHWWIVLWQQTSCCTPWW